MDLSTRVTRYEMPVKWLSIALLALSLLLVMRALPVVEGVDALERWIRDLGAAGMAVFGFIYVVAVLLLVPGSVLTLAAGALFGLIQGTLVVSLSATAAVALAFLISRHVARDRVARKIRSMPRFDAIDRAIGRRGWKIVALLRLSPAVPFNLQNYLYGLTRIGFLETVLTSAVAMLPGTFLYVYLGYLGRTGVTAAAEGAAADAGQWALRLVGLAATVAVTVYITRIARRVIREETRIADADDDGGEVAAGDPGERRWPWGTTILALAALLALGLAIALQFRPPAVTSGVSAGSDSRSGRTPVLAVAPWTPASGRPVPAVVPGAGT